MQFKQITSSHKALVMNRNTVTLSHIFEYNKSQISRFLLEPLTKKVCSIFFVSQYSIGFTKYQFSDAFEVGF